MTQRLINNYLNHLKNEGYSPNTIRAYKYGLAPLEEYNIEDLTTRDLMIIMGRDWDTSTASSRQSTLRSFYKWLQEQEVVDHDPTQALGTIRVLPSKRQYIPEEDIKAIISEINKAPLNVKVFFELLRDTDMQIEDLLDLDIEDITFSFDTATINQTITIKNQNLLDLCRLQQSGPLFLSNRGNRANYHWAYRWWKRINKNPQYTIHQFKKAQKETC